MRNNHKITIFLILAVLIAAAFIIFKMKSKPADGEMVSVVSPVKGRIRVFVSTTGTVLPKNRLEVKAPVNGRIESIKVKEGEDVRDGQVLAWMSSTERAALLDAAEGRGKKEVEHWQEVYKPIALLSPIDGEVIVATTQPGQTVTTADAVIVLSDHLIVRAQVDETDIGRVANGMKAELSLDAYPEKKIKARVEHIYYESQTVSNVTIYSVDLIPEEVPGFFRSGMNASVDFLVQEKDDILTIPVEAVHKDQENYVLLEQPDGKDGLKTRVELGISDDKNIEVVSGVKESDRIIVKSKKYTLPKSDTGTNPFLPSRKK